MQTKILVGSIFFIATLTWFVRCDEYLKEAPDFLKACQIHGTDFSDCFSEALQNIYTNWKDGIPGLDKVGSLDPFVLKKVRLSQVAENAADIKVQMKNVVAKGLSKSKVIKTFVNPKDYTFNVHIKMPHVTVDTDYRLKGRLLLLNLNGNGSLHSEISDVDYFITANTNLKRRGDELFFDITAINSEIKNVGGFHAHFTNLFNGNSALEESANHLINENWREFFQIMRPAITQINDAVSITRFKKIFNFIPAKYFISDLP